MIYSTAYGDLPAAARDEERAFWATPRHARSVRDEFSQIRTTMTEAQALTTLGDRPLIVLTAEKDAQGGWFAAQDKLAALSTNSVHRMLAERRPRHAHLAAGDRRPIRTSDPRRRQRRPHRNTRRRTGRLT